MTIVDLISVVTGNIYKKKASTKGGEYGGPCPWCGGDDRFGVYSATDHYVCRQCKRAGDSIQFVREYLSKNYFEACKFLEITPKRNTKLLSATSKRLGLRQDLSKWQPEEDSIPNELWRKRAEAILFLCFENMMSNMGKESRDFLSDRGITLDSIKKQRLGFNPSNLNYGRGSWGLVPDLDENGDNRQLWIPRGIVIPSYSNIKIWPDLKPDTLMGLQVRRSDIGAKPKYINISGSAKAWYSPR